MSKHLSCNIDDGLMEHLEGMRDGEEHVNDVVRRILTKAVTKHRRKLRKRKHGKVRLIREKGA